MKEYLKILFIFLILTGLSCVKKKTDDNSLINKLIKVACEENLFKEESFVEKTLNDEELQELKKAINDTRWIRQIENLGKILLSNYPFYSDTHDTGFNISIYHHNGKIVLLSSVIPIVNGSDKEAKAMIKTITSVSDQLIPNREIGNWIDKEWKISWDLYYKEDSDPSQVIRKKVFNNYLVTVWGVPPDIIFLNILNKNL